MYVHNRKSEPLQVIVKSQSDHGQIIFQSEELAEAGANAPASVRRYAPIGPRASRLMFVGGSKVTGREVSEGTDQVLNIILERPIGPLGSFLNPV